MRRLLCLLLIAFNADAQVNAPENLTKLPGEQIMTSWTNATTMVDGSPITGVTSTAVMWTPRVNDQCGGWSGEVIAPWPSTELAFSASVIGEGDWCLFAYHQIPNVASAWSNAVFVSIVGDEPEPDPPPDPNPFLQLTSATVYGFSKVANGVVFNEAGEAPVGSECLDQMVGAYHVVPVQSVTTWYGQVPNSPFTPPLVVLGECL